MGHVSYWVGDWLSDATDWLAAAGGIVGAIGGPAGLWAAWHQHRAEQRRRVAPPPEVVQHLLLLVNVGEEAKKRYRDEAWWAQSGARDAATSLVRLLPMLSDERLVMAIEAAEVWCDLASNATVDEGVSPTRVAETVAKQKERAESMYRLAKEALERARKLA